MLLVRETDKVIGIPLKNVAAFLWKYVKVYSIRSINKKI